MVSHKPFLKWVGGKSKQVPFIQGFLPQGDRLIEPFVGAGSIFLNCRFKQYLLADANRDLIQTYQQLILNRNAVVAKLERLFSTHQNQEGFLKVRATFNDDRYTDIEHSAAFIYLNKWGFNGLVRYNSKGEFNVGFGHLKERKMPDVPLAEIDAFVALKIPATSFYHQDFEITLNEAGAGDVVYCDPPYMQIPKNNKPVKKAKLYTGDYFGMDEQERLIQACLSAHQRGAKILINNSLNDELVSRYLSVGFSIQRMEARRSIAPKGSGRGNVFDVMGFLL